MSNRPEGFGLTAELNRKKANKYSSESEQVVVAWICAIVNRDAPAAGHDNVHAFLKDGTVLCELINQIAPGSVKKVNNSKMAFKQMENISKFLDALEAFGVKKLDSFQTVDLYEAGNIMQVYNCLFTLSSMATSKGYPGPSIGVKVATKNERNHSEESQRAGRNVSSLQMGTNQNASQKGMTGYGLGRQIVNDPK